MTGPAYALAWAALALLTPAAAFADSANLADLVDDLQRMQLQIAQGDKAAYPAQLAQLKLIRAAIAAAPPETWKDRRQADSLVIFILSGGALADVAPLLKGEDVVESERGLARGALAYVTNHEADAISLLGKEDLSALDGRVAAEVPSPDRCSRPSGTPRPPSSFSTGRACLRRAGWSRRRRSGAKSPSSPRPRMSAAWRC
jgi:hypothetical protein